MTGKNMKKTRPFAGKVFENHMMDIIQVFYTSDSGLILPELQWHEAITISRNKVVIQRNGKTPGTQVQAGRWEVAVDESSVAALFEQLSGIDVSKIKRVEPQESWDGGGTTSYTLVFSSSAQCSLVYDPGTTYTNGEWIVKPVQAFIQQIKAAHTLF
jgi:hypothetical protein